MFMAKKTRKVNGTVMRTFYGTNCHMTFYSGGRATKRRLTGRAKAMFCRISMDSRRSLRHYVRHVFLI